jgi:heptosyltransferase-2
MQLHVRGNKTLSGETFARILIRGTNWIGDVVMTLPAVAAIRKAWPQAKIAVLAKPWVAEVYRLSRPWTRCSSSKSQDGTPVCGENCAWPESSRSDTSRRRFLLQNAIEAAILARLAGIPVRAGYNADGRGLLLTHSVRRTRAVRQVHQIDYYLEMVSALGCRPQAGRSAWQPGAIIRRSPRPSWVASA